MTAGERPVGLTRDAGWQVGVSRTLAVDLDTVWAHLVSPEGLDTWLGLGARPAPERGARYETEDATTGEIRSWREGDRLRATRQAPGDDHETTVQVALGATPTGTRMTLHQERMASAAERQRMREHWRSVADAFEEALAGG